MKVYGHFYLSTALNKTIPSPMKYLFQQQQWCVISGSFPIESKLAFSHQPMKNGGIARGRVGSTSAVVELADNTTAGRPHDRSFMLNHLGSSPPES